MSSASGGEWGRSLAAREAAEVSNASVASPAGNHPDIHPGTMLFPPGYHLGCLRPSARGYAGPGRRGSPGDTSLSGVDLR